MQGLLVDKYGQQMRTIENEMAHIDVSEENKIVISIDGERFTAQASDQIESSIKGYFNVNNFTVYSGQNVNVKSYIYTTFIKQENKMKFSDVI